MTRPRPVSRPAGYAEIERALHLLDEGEGSRWVANRLHGVAHPAAREAQRLLRAGERGEAESLLWRALLAMAGPCDGERMTWFTAASADRPARQGAHHGR